MLFAAPKLTRLPKLSGAALGAGGLGAMLPEPWADSGVLRPEAKGDGVGRREG